MMLKNLNIHMQKKIGPLSYTYIKINSKWIKSLNIKPETVKLLKWNVRGKILDIGPGNDFIFNITPMLKQQKQKGHYISLKIFCRAKETINRVKGHPTEWEKIFANHLADKGLVSKIYKNLLQLSSKQTNKQTKNHKNKQPD